MYIICIYVYIVYIPKKITLKSPFCPSVLEHFRKLRDRPW